MVTNNAPLVLYKEELLFVLPAIIVIVILKPTPPLRGPPLRRRGIFYLILRCQTFHLSYLC